MSYLAEGRPATLIHPRDRQSVYGRCQGAPQPGRGAIPLLLAGPAPGPASISPVRAHRRLVWNLMLPPVAGLEGCRGSESFQQSAPTPLRAATSSRPVPQRTARRAADVGPGHQRRPARASAAARDPVSGWHLTARVGTDDLDEAEPDEVRRFELLESAGQAALQAVSATGKADTGPGSGGPSSRSG
jgi:hypothetical protein